MNHNLTAEEKIKRDDRVRYYVIKLKDVMSKSKLLETIEKNGVTSKSTAERVSKGVFYWNKGEVELFLATYTPTKSDIKVIEEVLGIDTSKVSSEVKGECIGDDKQFEEELKDGDIVEFESKKYKFVETGKFTSDDCQKCDLFAKYITNEEVCICGRYIYNVVGYFKEIEIKQEEDKCTECDTEAARIINELSAKNQELQKELHTSKNVITTLQKGVEELNETVTESKCIIAEICKERDDKAEEIRFLNLELQKYKNDLNTVLDDRQKLECLLSDNANAIELNPKYDSLYKVLLSAYNQASCGKRKERHANDEPFENQKIITLNKQIGSNHGAIFQACKKAQESARLPHDRAIMELLGAINYLAAAVIMLQQEEK